MDAASEQYLWTACRVERHMATLNLCGCDKLRCLSCMLIMTGSGRYPTRFIGINVLDCTLRVFMEMNHSEIYPMTIHHPGPHGWRGVIKGFKKIFKSFDFDSMDKLIIFGRSHVLVSSSLLWMFFNALAYFGRRILPLHTKSEMVGRADEIPMETTVLMPSSRHALAKLRRDGARGTIDEGDLQYYNNFNDSDSEVPQSRKRKKEQLIDMAVNSGAGDAASVSYPFVSYSSASGSAITQELLFCVLGRVNLPKRDAVWTKKEIARQCAFRRITEQAMSYFYLTGEVQQVVAEKGGVITRSMAIKLARDETQIRRQKEKAEQGCVCVAE